MSILSGFTWKLFVFLYLSGMHFYFFVDPQSGDVGACNGLMNQCMTCGLVKPDCQCLNGGKCNTTDGSCTCPPAFDGKFCETRIQCDPPEIVAGVNWKGDSMNIGDEIIAECRFGYSLIGAESRVCMADGTWVPKAPICKASCGLKESSELWPWQAAIYRLSDSKWSSNCSGTLISENWVVTAAYCVSERLIRKPLNATNFKVYLGKAYKEKYGEEVEIFVKTFIIHPNYHPRTFDSNIALIELSKSVEFGRSISPICLPQPLNVDTEVFSDDLQEGVKGEVTGWGRKGKPRALSMPIIDRSSCEEGYWTFPETVTGNSFCAGFENNSKESVSSCDIDFGAPFSTSTISNDNPVVMRWTLEGVVSGGKRRCGRYPSYITYVYVAKFVPWIKSYVHY